MQTSPREGTNEIKRTVVYMLIARLSRHEGTKKADVSAELLEELDLAQLLVLTMSGDVVPLFADGVINLDSLRSYVDEIVKEGYEAAEDE